jgi:hypothetical protein
MFYCSRGPTCTIVVEAPRFAHQVGRRLRGLLSRWVTLGLNDLRSPPTLSDDSHDCKPSLDGRSTIDSEIVQSLCFISEQNCPGLNWTYCPRGTYDETGLLLPGSQATSDAQRTLCPTECGQPESSPATVVGGSAVVRSACSASVVMPCALYHVTSCA